MSHAALRTAHLQLEAGQHALAAESFEALRQQSESKADALNGLGLCAETRQDLNAAEVFYRQALALRQEPEFINNLAICLMRQGRFEEGLALFDQLTNLAQVPPQAWHNLVMALVSFGRPWDAFTVLRKVLTVHPRLEQAVELLQQLIHQLGTDAQVLERFRKLLAADPSDPVCHLALGIWYEMAWQDELALRYVRAALRCNPALLGAYRLQIHILRMLRRYTEALERVRECYQGEFSPDAVLETVITLQEPIVMSDEQVQAIREEMLALLDSAEGLRFPAGQTALPRSVPFYLVYQWGEDRPLQEKIAAFFARVLGRHTQPPVANPRPRLGIVSTHLYRHSVTDLLQRALETLLTSGDFETYVFYHPVDNGHEDELTRTLQQQANHFVTLGPDFEAAVRTLHEAQLDLLIYPDIGMDVFTYGLAINRLARHQLALPGHPVTTGMQTMDYFVSAEALEPPESEHLYSETLIRLPGLPDYARPTIPPLASRETLGLPQGHLYFCPMTLFKLQPAFDEVMAKILQRDPDALILLLEFKNGLHTTLQRRFAGRYPDLSERLHFLPWSHRERFFQRLQAVDVLLDSFPFGGGNTAYQALGLGCPIVTLEQPWNKGRWTQAMYQLMGIHELIAPDRQAYVDLAVAVASDPARQARLRTQLLDRSTILFDNPTWSDALLAFCRGLVGSTPSDV